MPRLLKFVSVSLSDFIASRGNSGYTAHCKSGMSKSPNGTLQWYSTIRQHPGILVYNDSYERLYYLQKGFFFPPPSTIKGMPGRVKALPCGHLRCLAATAIPYSIHVRRSPTWHGSYLRSYHYGLSQKIPVVTRCFREISTNLRYDFTITTVPFYDEQAPFSFCHISYLLHTQAVLFSVTAIHGFDHLYPVSMCLV